MLEKLRQGLTGFFGRVRDAVLGPTNPLDQPHLPFSITPKTPLPRPGSTAHAILVYATEGTYVGTVVSHAIDQVKERTHPAKRLGVTDPNGAPWKLEDMTDEAIKAHAQARHSLVINVQGAQRGAISNLADQLVQNNYAVQLRAVFLPPGEGTLRRVEGYVDHLVQLRDNPRLEEQPNPADASPRVETKAREVFVAAVQGLSDRVHAVGLLDEGGHFLAHNAVFLDEVKMMALVGEKAVEIDVGRLFNQATPEQAAGMCLRYWERAVEGLTLDPRVAQTIEAGRRMVLDWQQDGQKSPQALNALFYVEPTSRVATELVQQNAGQVLRLCGLDERSAPLQAVAAQSDLAPEALKALAATGNAKDLSKLLTGLITLAQNKDGALAGKSASVFNDAGVTLWGALTPGVNGQAVEPAKAREVAAAVEEHCGGPEKVKATSKDMLRRFALDRGKGLVQSAQQAELQQQLNGGDLPWETDRGASRILAVTGVQILYVEGPGIEPIDAAILPIPARGLAQIQDQTQAQAQTQARVNAEEVGTDLADSPAGGILMGGIVSDGERQRLGSGGLAPLIGAVSSSSPEKLLASVGDRGNQAATQAATLSGQGEQSGGAGKTTEATRQVQGDAQGVAPVAETGRAPAGRQAQQPGQQDRSGRQPQTPTPAAPKKDRGGPSR